MKKSRQRPQKIRKVRRKRYQGMIPKRHQFIGFTIEHWRGWGKDQDHDGRAELRNQKGHLRGPEYWDALCRFEYRWRVLARVRLQVPGEDREIIKDYEMVTEEACKLNDIEGVYKDCESELLAKTQSRHIVDVGWWACPIA